ncbi:hypothetical protein PMAYCL1PPCAC_14617, partial [Pristionchus mayeri]
NLVQKAIDLLEQVKDNSEDPEEIRATIASIEMDRQMVQSSGKPSDSTFSNLLTSLVTSIDTAMEWIIEEKMERRIKKEEDVSEDDCDRDEE